MLLNETGKSLIQHTYESACQSQKASQIIVATDSSEIQAEVESFGGKVVMTDPNHSCGTDRVAEVAASLTVDIVLNLQGDEPELPVESIDLAIELLESRVGVPMATLAVPIEHEGILKDPNCVKVVLDNQSNALYFSRSPIPFPRDGYQKVANRQLFGEPPFFQHLGIYAYRREFLLELTRLPPAP